MANRLSTLPRPSFSLDRSLLPARPTLALRKPTGDELRLIGYRLLWSPLWLGSDVPAPALPRPDAALPPGGLAGDHLARHLQLLARRIWLLRAFTVVARALWLPILIGCGWMGLELLGGPELQPWALLWIGGVLMLPALLFAYLERPTKREIARMLDHSFGLQDRMITAYDHLGTNVPAPGEQARISYLQIADAANIVTELRRHHAFRVRPPVREIVLGIASALLLASLFFLRGVGGGIPMLGDGSVPTFVRAADRLAKVQQPAQQPNAALTDAKTVAQVNEEAKASNQAAQDLKTIADAMANQAATRDASDAIMAGDYDKAAELIRQAGANADQMSQPARDALADELDQAAEEIGDSNPELANAASDAAAGLRQGGQAAQDGMNELADAVEQTGNNVVPQSQLADDMRRAQAADAADPNRENQTGQGDQANQNGSTGDPNGSGGDQSNPGDQANNGDNPDASANSGSNSSANNNNGDPKTNNGDNSGQADGSNQGENPNGNQSNKPGDNAGYGQVAGKQASDNPGSGGQPGEGDPQDANGSTNSTDTTGDQKSGEGGGAGSKAGDPNAGDQNTPGGDNNTQTSNGQTPSDPNITQADQNGNAAPEADAHDAVTLSTSDSGGVQSSSSSDGKNPGSGPGNASVSQGTVVQGQVGEAGPDSNRVPAEYRSVVEDYFSEDGS